MSIHWGGRGPGHISRQTVPPVYPGAALYLDMLSNTLDSRVTFTRGSIGTFIGGDGLIQSAANNVPRFNHNPVTRARLGLLIEGSRTNLLLNSLINGTNLSTQGVTVTAAAHTISFYGTGTITLTGVHSATVVGTGAYPTRTTLTFTPTAGTLTCTVSGTVQFAQLELGAFATSFIPTAGTAVARSADNASMTGSNFSSWYNNSAGTFFVEFTPDLTVALDTRVLNVSGGGATARVVDANSSGTNWGSFNGTGNLTTGAASVTSTPQKLGAAYAASDYALTLNGAAPATRTDALLNTPNQIQIGNFDGSQRYLHGHIRRLAYYNTRLANAQMQALTA
jgi:hypothetical protein